MKNNSSHSSYFHLALFTDMGSLRYLYFSLCFLIYLLINCANVAIILTVCLERSLHQPMYVFICCLSFNSLRGAAGFFPRFLSDLLSDTHFISRLSCFVQVFVLYMYATGEMAILGIMAYDRFVAVCQPLRYRSKMTFRTVLRLIVLAELYPAFICSCCISLTIRLPLCGIKVQRLFCTNWPLVRLSCVDTGVNNIAGLLAMVATIFIPLLFVLYSYLRILLVSRRSSHELRGKALQTCLPHIVTCVNYSVCFVGELLLNRLRDDEINPLIVVALSLEFLIIPPIVNPLVYGLKLPQIRTVVFRYFSKIFKRLNRGNG
ncbi:olfactory receptor 51E1-like [Fundulus heteroclitus]|uniref:olfactory receptor 51E1-like n=1 Tax=Fundulus heteroclitus TaxID=8078 RepID=UPI00165BDAB1|nr:olfactory receptor 51E1-like [Fundulus heteroclitus]